MSESIRVRYDGEFWRGEIDSRIYGSQDVVWILGDKYVVYSGARSWGKGEEHLVEDQYGSTLYRKNWIKHHAALQVGHYVDQYGIERSKDDTPEPVRAQILDEAKSLITGDRNKSYGSPVQNFSNTAAMWNVQFGHMLKEGESFTPANIAQAMVLLKMARMIAGSKHDNWADAIGYAACGAECDEASE